MSGKRARALRVRAELLAKRLRMRASVRPTVPAPVETAPVVPFSEMTRDELRALAAVHNVKGRSKMTKVELTEALEGIL